MTLYDIFRYTNHQIKEVDYLIDQAFKLGIEDRVQEAFFQFSPDLVDKKIPGFGEHEPWAVFHKRVIINEIIFFLIEQYTEDEYKRDVLYDNQIWNEEYTDFVLETDMRKMERSEIIKKFKKYMEEK